MMYLNYTQIPSQRSTQRLLYVRKADAHLVFRIGRDLESRLGTVIPENANNGCALDMLESAEVDCEAAIPSEVSSSLKLRFTSKSVSKEANSPREPPGSPGIKVCARTER